MKQIIAVQEGLTPLSELLERKGYQVLDLDRADMASVSAVVLTGMSDNMLGDQRTKTKAPVFDAGGKTPDQIVKAIENVLH